MRNEHDKAVFASVYTVALFALTAYLVTTHSAWWGFLLLAAVMPKGSD